jgi:ornithine cyclodeaminase/alanine dehydrogenase
MTRILSKNHIADVLRMPDVIEAVRTDLTGRPERQTQPSQTITSHEENGRIYVVKSSSGFSLVPGAAGVSVTTSGQETSSSGRSLYQSSVFLLFDLESGDLKAILDGREITLLRAAASCAIAARLLANKDEKNMLLVGAGGLATAMLKGSVESLPGLKQVSITSRDPRRTEGFISSQSPRYPHLRFVDLSFFDLEDHVRENRYIVTASSSGSPLIKKEWVAPGTHITAAGTNSPKRQELDPGIIAASRIFAEDTDQASRIGECRVGVETGLISMKDITGIGDVIEGKATGRTESGQVTVFDMTGTSLEEILVAQLALKRSTYRNTGYITGII